MIFQNHLDLIYRSSLAPNSRFVKNCFFFIYSLKDASHTERLFFMEVHQKKSDGDFPHRTHTKRLLYTTELSSVFFQIRNF